MRKFCSNCRKEVDLKNDRMSDAKICSLCGTVVIHAATQLQPGSIVGGFQVESEIGRGGMGIVYRAKQLNLERQVALKVLADDLARDESFVDSFFREARAAAGLSHPNIVQVYDAGSTPEGIYYFAMELVVGETLDTRISRDGALNPRDALAIAGKIASALNYAWQTQQLCHGDIKPDNIILNSSGGAKLADLGLAKFMHEDKGDGIQELMGTPLYAPPEVIRGELSRIDCRSDMYSFGATLFHMLAGVPPFPGSDPEAVLERHLHEEPPSLLDFNRELSPQIQELILKLLDKRIEDRPETWTEVEKMLLGIHNVERKIFHRGMVHHHGVTPKTTEEAQTDPASALIKLLAAIALGLVIAIVGFYFWQGRVPPPERAGVPQEVPSAEASAAEAWAQLHPRLPVNRSDAIAMIEAFLLKHGLAAPPEARQALEQRRSELEQMAHERTRREQERADFEVQVAGIREKISRTTIAATTELAQLQALATEIEALLERGNRHEHLKLAPDETQALNATYMQITAVIVEQERRGAEQQRQEQERLAQEQRKKERIAREEQLHRQQAMLAVNAACDEYYSIIAEFLAKRNLAALVKELGGWHDRHQTVPGEILARHDFLIQQVIPAIGDLPALIQRHESAFLNETLPDDLPPPQYRRYKVESLNENGMRLYIEIDRAKFGHNLLWNQIPPEPLAAWLLSRLPHSGLAMNLKEQRAFLTHMLISRPATLSNALAMTKDIPAPERAIWQGLANDFMQAPRERTLIERWRAMQAALAQRHQSAAAAILGELQPLAVGSLFYERYQTEISRLLAELGDFDTTIHLANLLDQSGDALNQGTADTALHLVMTAKARYGNTPELDEQLRQRLDNAVGQTLDAVRKASRVTGMEDNRLPFYYWERENPGDAWVYAAIVRESGVFNDHPRRDAIQASIDSAASLDAGDWAQARIIGTLAIPPERMAAMRGRMRAWTPAMAFGQGLLAYRYQASEERLRWLNALNTMAGDATDMPMKALAAILQLEYALMTVPPRGTAMAAQYQYSGNHPELEIRLAQLHLLAILRAPDSTIEDFTQACARHEQAFRAHAIVRPDLEYARATLDILTGKWDPARVNQLRQLKCSSPDLAARVMIEAAARALLAGTAIPGEPALRALLNDAISGNVPSGELWQRAMTYHLARISGQPAAMRGATTQWLDDRRLCAMASYPRLCAVDICLKVADGTYDRATGRNVLTRLLAASPITADAEMAWPEAITSAAPQDLVTQLALRGRVDSAYWCAVLAMIVNHENPETLRLIHAAIIEHQPFLSAPERLLIVRLRTPR